MTQFQRLIYDLLTEPKSEELLTLGLMCCLGRVRRDVAGPLAAALISMYKQRLVNRKVNSTVWRRTL